MGSVADKDFCEKIHSACGSYGINYIERISSAHKTPDDTLRLLAEYDGMPVQFDQSSTRHVA